MNKNRIWPKSRTYSVLQDSEHLLSPGPGFAGPHSPGLSRTHLDSDDGIEFNPYEEPQIESVAMRRQSVASSVPPEELGYGGGSWTYSQIASKEKQRLQDEEDELDIAEQRRETAAETLPRYSVS